ncbi:MAG: 3-phosphoshikimate 1-carboxyvinyltransferase, partial [Pseudomonadota bacterium]|nr:3-phosphoshikimate 1-carboxyvinyltransferase [Pseudomonadota bacterium]
VHDILPDGMRIQGVADGPAFTGGDIDSQGDHRVAMAFAIASLRAAGPITIRDVDNVATSFPGFLEASQSVGLGLARHGR